MALTNAERERRYVQKRNQDSARREAYLIKEKQRSKSRYVPIKDLPPRHVKGQLVDNGKKETR